MLAAEFLKTIYLGDRGCKSITINGWDQRVVIQVNEISRVRSAAGNWDYYNDENIVDGLLVFTDVRSIYFDPAGPIPNDYIEFVEVELLPDDYYRFKTSVGSVNDSAESKDILAVIESKSVHLEDPATPGVLIED
ncbi:MAG: DUF6258 family protein [Terracidiphilus sp.]|jgi:hypothetical protein